METFSADWLALREPADHAARDAGVESAVVAALARHTPAHGITVVDLGAGAGSNLRHLAPRLPWPQRWQLVDHDGTLLRAASAAPPQGVEVMTERRDLRHVDATLFPPARPLLVTGAALLDLTSRDWLALLAARCRTAEAAVLFALTYDGRVACDPPDPFDETVQHLVNRHQHGDKGFGPAAGPDAASAAAEVFRAEGFTVQLADSTWQLDATQPDLQAQLVAGWAEAAKDVYAMLTVDINTWRDRRLALIARGESRIHVGHQDLGAWLA